MELGDSEEALKSQRKPELVALLRHYIESCGCDPKPTTSIRSLLLLLLPRTLSQDKPLRSVSTSSLRHVRSS
ncbi:Hypothetical protein FKW44_005438 [Caligus rogercresseyi]|uniref:Uncharacterized protein n=1 Tax=Caligus rogercresseyi TaxID=217165 RepID=A0A7T8QS06_CALRO|nr:Hypothetical protein FKW44_005438 [Caligus rogercresseyi]